MITRFYSFGPDHARTINGVTYDDTVLVRVSAPDPRAVMFETFGRDWSMEYHTPLDPKYFPGGIKELP